MPSRVFPVNVFRENKEEIVLLQLPCIDNPTELLVEIELFKKVQVNVLVSPGNPAPPPLVKNTPVPELLSNELFVMEHVSALKFSLFRDIPFPVFEVIVLVIWMDI